MADFEDLLSDNGAFAGALPWDQLYRLAEKSYSLEGQELAASLLMEPHGDLIDDLADTMYTTYSARLEPTMILGDLRTLIEDQYAWALKDDNPEKQKHFWYYSEDKLEPRLGERDVDPGAEQEIPLAIARDVTRLHQMLKKKNSADTVASFVMAYPEYRYVVRRIQTIAHFPYGEIYDSMIDSKIRPLDMLRFKLAFFGASKFDPKSDLWTRITMFQGAPMPNELDHDDVDIWAFPVKPTLQT